jgi:hypothetical protein
VSEYLLWTVIEIDGEEDNPSWITAYRTKEAAIEAIRMEQIESMDRDELADMLPDEDWETRDPMTLTLEELGLSVSAIRRDDAVLVCDKGAAYKNGYVVSPVRTVEG